MKWDEASGLPVLMDDVSGLDKQTLSVCVGMIEAGANPDTLAVSLSTGNLKNC